MIYLAIAYAVFLIWTIVELVRAPWGYEDSRGFHFGKKNNQNYKKAS